MMQEQTQWEKKGKIKIASSFFLSFFDQDKIALIFILSHLDNQ